MSKHWPDFAIALAIFLIAAFWGGRFVQGGGITPSFYQRTFAPAVMQACGKGFISPARLDDIPTLSDFLHLKADAFSCAQIPAQFEQEDLNSIASRPTRMLQLTSRYLMGAVAQNWRLTGVSWNALLPLYALLYGLSIVAVYGVFRLAMEKPLATVLALLILVSPMQLNHLPHLRDYGKAPFALAMILVSGWMVKCPLHRIGTMLLGALGGIVLGIGIGFRADLLIFLPVIPVALLAFTTGGLFQEKRIRLGAAALFAMAFGLVGWPILSVMGGGGNMFHVILLGLFSPFNQALNVHPSSVYEWGYLYNDAYVNVILNDYAHRVLGSRERLQFATQAYDQAGMAYYLDILRQFPADILTRSLAATLQIVQSSGFENQWPWTAKLSAISVLLAILVVSLSSLRLALFALLAVLFLASYPSLQFDQRHYFHLQFVPWFFFGLLVQQITSKGLQIAGRQGSNAGIPTLSLTAGAGRRAASLMLALLGILGTYLATRAYQAATVPALLKNYEALRYSAREIRSSPNADNTVRLRPSKKDGLGSDVLSTVEAGYWGLELDAGKCDRYKVTVRIQYRSSDPFLDFSRNVSLDTGASLRYIFHTFSSIGGRFGAYWGLSEFDGIDVNREDLPCIRKFGELAGFEALPLLINLTFAKGWEIDPIYQRFGWETDKLRSKRGGIALFTFPERLAMPRSYADALLERVVGIPASTMSVIDKSAVIAEEVLTVKGDAPSAFGYALQLPAENFNGGRYLVAEGEVFDGGLTLGLLKNNQWVGQTNITTAGKFRVVMKPEAGDYTAVLAHNVPNQKFNHFKVTKLGWVREGEKADAANPERSNDSVRSEKAAAKSFLAFPENLAISEKQVSELLAGVRVPATNTPAIDKTVTITNGAVTVKGDAPSSFSYALGLRPEKSSGGRYLVAEGELFDGGLTLGLLRNNAWAGQTNVTTPGKFKIIMKPEAGEYTAMLAHNVPGRKFNNFKLTKLGWSPEIK